jgi:hypothetical protein
MGRLQSGEVPSGIRPRIYKVNSINKDQYHGGQTEVLSSGGKSILWMLIRKWHMKWPYYFSTTRIIKSQQINTQRKKLII